MKIGELKYGITIGYCTDEISRRMVPLFIVNSISCKQDGTIIAKTPVANHKNLEDAIHELKIRHLMSGLKCYLRTDEILETIERSNEMVEIELRKIFKKLTNGKKKRKIHAQAPIISEDIWNLQKAFYMAQEENQLQVFIRSNRYSGKRKALAKVAPMVKKFGKEKKFGKKSSKLVK